MDDSSFYTKIYTSFDKDVIRESLKTQHQNNKTKITEDALDSVNEILKMLVIECALRATKAASIENKTTVTLEHVENVLASMMLDFP